MDAEAAIRLIKMRERSSKLRDEVQLLLDDRVRKLYEDEVAKLTKERGEWLNEKHEILGHVREWEDNKKELEAEIAKLKEVKI